MKLRLTIPEPEPVGTVDDWISDRKAELFRLSCLITSRPDLRPEIADRLLECRLDIAHLMEYRSDRWRRD